MLDCYALIGASERLLQRGEKEDGAQREKARTNERAASTWNENFTNWTWPMRPTTRLAELHAAETAFRDQRQPRNLPLYKPSWTGTIKRQPHGSSMRERPGRNPIPGRFSDNETKAFRCKNEGFPFNET